MGAIGIGIAPIPTPLVLGERKFYLCVGNGHATICGGYAADVDRLLADEIGFGIRKFDGESGRFVFAHRHRFAGEIAAAGAFDAPVAVHSVGGNGEFPFHATKSIRL